MLRQYSLNLTLLLFGSDMILTLIAIHVAKVLRLTLPYGIEVSPNHLNFPWVIYPIVGGIWCVVFLIVPLYDVRKTYRAIDQLQMTIVGTAFATLLFAGVAYFFFRELSRFLFVYFFLLDVGLLLGVRIVLRAVVRLWRGGWPGQKTRLLILGSGAVGQRIGEALQAYRSFGVEVIGILDDAQPISEPLLGKVPYLGGLGCVMTVVEQEKVDEVILALPSCSRDESVALARQLQSVSVQVRAVPDLFELSFVKTTVEEFEGIPLVSLGTSVLGPFQQMVKRGFDLLIGSIALVVSLPLMATVALIIKLDSPGSVFYTSTRVGQNGRLFKMIKFRSMELDADHRRAEVITYTPEGMPIHKRADDPRVTRVGRFIRQTSLDELPQLINVLKGEMSLIGPRPELPWLVDRYEPWQYQRFSVPQGMTGWWQVNGRGDKPMHLHVEEDLYYIQNYSLVLDIIILWKTFGAVLKRSGAF